MSDSQLSPDDYLCLEIIREKNYYKILDVNEDSSIEQVKKFYKIKALKIHPDKNKSRFSQEAFQKLSKAFMCLNSETLRKLYDETGNEEIPDQTIDQSVDPDFAERIFSEVLSDLKKSKSQTPIYKSYLTKCLLLQLIPIFIILFLTMHTTSLQNSSEFSFFISSHYNVRKFIKPSNITYYIPSNLNRELTESSQEALELKVIEDYKSYQEYLSNKSAKKTNKKNDSTPIDPPKT